MNAGDVVVVVIGEYRSDREVSHMSWLLMLDHRVGH